MKRLRMIKNNVIARNERHCEEERRSNLIDLLFGAVGYSISIELQFRLVAATHGAFFI